MNYVRILWIRITSGYCGNELRQDTAEMNDAYRNYVVEAWNVGILLKSVKTSNVLRSSQFLKIRNHFHATARCTQFEPTIEIIPWNTSTMRQVQVFQHSDDLIKIPACFVFNSIHYCILTSFLCRNSAKPEIDCCSDSWKPGFAAGPY